MREGGEESIAAATIADPPTSHRRNHDQRKTSPPSLHVSFCRHRGVRRREGEPELPIYPAVECVATVHACSCHGRSTQLPSLFAFCIYFFVEVEVRGGRRGDGEGEGTRGGVGWGREDGEGEEEGERVEGNGSGVGGGVSGGVGGVGGGCGSSVGVGGGGGGERCPKQKCHKLDWVIGVVRVELMKDEDGG
ncbi:uncharacterized protein LOC130974753 [Arachis stenosperma]|uniref:uncharacterized protein LOC130974753 n=1 Tax=Arachis stenosperma TaxID=217475 RepID=UPI0025ACB274|nr:uncharacterized protein LOC130974753 [Arachis stenosperma]